MSEGKISLTIEEFAKLMNSYTAALSVLELTVSKQQQRAEPWQGTVITLLDRPVKEVQRVLKDGLFYGKT